MYTLCPFAQLDVINVPASVVVSARIQGLYHFCSQPPRSLGKSDAELPVQGLEQARCHGPALSSPFLTAHAGFGYVFDG